MCGRNESLSCAPVKKSILPEKMIGQNRKVGRTLDGQLALQQTTLLRIVNVRQVQVQLACRTRKEREGFTRLWGTAIICHRQQKVSQRHTAARTPVVAFTLPTARREIFNRGVDSDPAEFQLIRLSRRKL